jgi:uncharacterized membrane protein YagU involved in acid resistance
MARQRKSAVVRMVRGTMAGMIGGLVAAYAMNQFQAAFKSPPRKEQPRGAASKGTSTGDTEARASRQQQEGGADATVKTAQAISRNLFDHDLSDREKQIAGPAIHYAYGVVVGGLYGGLAEIWPTLSAGLGMPYGAVLWAIGDEVAVPALGLSQPPTKYPLATHADALSTHFVYGITLDIVRRVARHLV